MGRYSYSNRSKVENCHILDIKEFGTGFSEKTKQLNEELGDDIWNYCGERNCLYAVNGEQVSYSIKVVATPCNYGGGRYWFVCPLIINGKPCERRSKKLYLPPGAKYFGCRHCYNLTYRARNENRRSKNYPLFHILDLFWKTDEQSVKRFHYAGKPTRKLRRLQKAQAKVAYAYLLAKQKRVL